jgi:eukaryotic-like serine/threonine-protein kinase
MKDPASLIGKNVDQFRLDEFIGRGAMGVVYKAHDNVLRRSVALKLIPKGEEEATPAMLEARRRLIQEAQAAGCLTHPNIVTIHSYGETDEFQYICMEYIAGKTLAQVITEKKVLSVEEAVAIVEQVLMALDRANQEHIVHRDIKPANIMLLPDKRVKVMDFGIAKLPSLSTTTTGTILGTPYYMSPEQISGNKVDILSDIFSVGAVFYQMITGERPFEGETTVTLAYKIVQIEPVPPKILNIHIPLAVENICKKALAKDPSQRYQTPKEMLQDLRDFKNMGATVRTPAPLTTDDATIKSQVPLPPPSRPMDLGGDRTVVVTEGTIVRPEAESPKPVAEEKKPEPPAPPPPAAEEKKGGTAVLTPPKKKEPIPPVMLKSPPKPSEPEKKSGSGPKALVIVVVAVLVLGAGGYGVMRYLRGGAQPVAPAPAPAPQVIQQTPQPTPPAPPPAVSPAPTPAAPAVPPAGPSLDGLVQQAKEQLKSNPANARKLLDQVLAQDPHNFEATLQLARLLTFQKDFKGAIPVYEKAQQINSRVPEVPFNMGFIYMSQGNFDQAIRYYEMCRSLSPSFQDEVLTNLGFCYLQKKNRKMAKILFSEAIRMNPQNAIAKNYLKSIGG